MEKNLDILRPSMIRKSVAEIDFKELREYGLTRVIMDLDGTIAPNLSYKYDQACVHHLLEAKANGWIEDICLLSNCAIPFLIPRVEKIAKLLNIKWHACVWPNAMKPDAVAFTEAMYKIGGTAENTVVIGDQLETDILGGNQLDLHTIFVRTIGMTPFWKQLQSKKQDELMAEMRISFPE